MDRRLLAHSECDSGRKGTIRNDVQYMYSILGVMEKGIYVEDSRDIAEDHSNSRALAHGSTVEKLIRREDSQVDSPFRPMGPCSG